MKPDTSHFQSPVCVLKPDFGEHVSHELVGDSIFRLDNDIERRFEIVDDSTATELGWLYKGRDPAMEQEIIRRIKNAL